MTFSIPCDFIFSRGYTPGKTTRNEYNVNNLRKKDLCNLVIIDIIMTGLRMKNNVNRRKNYLRNRIYDKKTVKLCQSSMETTTFTRNRKITYSDILMLALNKQGKNTSFEIRDYEINKKGKQCVDYTDEAYLKKRRQLNPEVFREFNRGYLKDFYHEKKYVKRYRGCNRWL